MGPDWFYTALQLCGVILISLRPVAAKWTGVLLLCVSLWLEIMSAENAAFAAVSWVLGLGFAVIMAALLRTGKRMVETRAGILTPASATVQQTSPPVPQTASARQHAPSGPRR
ncbi:hypothetical protein [Acetobacter malorum]|uniref:hypothetical protein n=1 Tax=Acetobacter malorum TaxID=178901 RepID=UPI000776AF0D|nr:hypothetical protein [Acetobacter malorum]KXV08475.1 hypothetical protein AD930_04065 [Acetobacter malorum]